MYLSFFLCHFGAWCILYLFKLTNQISNYIGNTLLLIECTNPLWKWSIMANCKKNMVRGNFSWFISYTDLSYTLWCVYLLSSMTILQKMCRKFNIELYLLYFISIYMCLPPPKHEKMWSEEIIARIALKLTHVPIFLFVSFWGLMYMASI